MSYPYRSAFFDRLGVRSWINASNWSTALGGTYLEPAVLEAMADVSQTFVDMGELLSAACDRVAELCKVDAAYITTGAAAGISLSTAACIAGVDQSKWDRLPATEGMRNEVLMHKGHICGYETQYTAVGAELVFVDRPFHRSETQRQMYERAITERTASIAAIYSYNVATRNMLPFEEVVALAKSHGLRTQLDAAALVPPVSNLSKFTDMGFDLVTLSGGKGIRGPQNTGLILGGGDRGKALIEAIRRNTSPNHGLGRPLKVSKEAIAGLVTALEIFTAEGHEAEEYQRQMMKAEYLELQLRDIKHVEVSIVPNDGVRFEHPMQPRVPRVQLEIDTKALGVSLDAIYQAMAAGDPPIKLRTEFAYYDHSAFTSHGICLIDTYFLRDGEEKIVADRLRTVLTKN
jgi:L-seryl-tRNA(Ser) seleniumtransferase